MSKNNVKQGKPHTWEKALEAFLWWKQASGLSETTLKDYTDYVSRFFKNYPDSYQDENILKHAVYEYMGKSAKPAYYNLKLIYLKAFFTWCVDEGVLSANPLKSFKKRKAEGRVVNLDNETLKKLIDLPDKRTFAGLRDYCLIILTLDCGIRPKEAFSLLKTDIDFRALEIHIRAENAKTRTSRTLSILPIIAKKVRQLIDARHPAWDESIPVFCTVDGRPLDRKSWAARMRLYSERLEIKITPYYLRHAFALGFLRNHGNIFVLKQTLGHSSLTMSQNYLAITQADIREQHALASPLNNLLPQKNRVRNL